MAATCFGTIISPPSGADTNIPLKHTANKISHNNLTNVVVSTA